MTDNDTKLVDKSFNYCLCGCGEPVPVFDKWHPYSKPRQYKNHHHPLKQVHLFKEKNGQWKGGRIIDTHGYIQIYQPNHPRANGLYVKEHILVFEDTYNCCLLRWSIVHHKDHNRQNNVWSNLMGMMRGQHSKHHKNRKPFNEWNHQMPQKAIILDDIFNQITNRK